jgi:hypothetical protein
LGAAVLERDGVVVACEADDIDQQRRLGWSVVVTGLAQLVRDPDLIARYQAALLPWIGLPMDQVLRVRTDLVTGFRFN